MTCKYKQTFVGVDVAIYFLRLDRRQTIAPCLVFMVEYLERIPALHNVVLRE